MHKASHAEFRLAGDEVPDPDMKHEFNSGGIEKISFKMVKEITVTKERALQNKILGYKKP